MKKKTGIISFCVIAFATGVVELVKYLSGRESPKYSYEWMQSLSDDELEIEREKVRQYFCSAEKDLSSAIKAESILEQFDREMSNREWQGHAEYGYPEHSEHGWYLSEDD